MTFHLKTGWSRAVVLVVGLLLPVNVQAQDLSAAQRGTNELGFTTGGAARIPGGTRQGNFWAVQLRWGRIMTAPHGPGALRGTFEYAVEVVPAMVIIERDRTLFGGGLTPLLLQYNFTQGQQIVPFIQAGAGMLFTTAKFPEGTSQFNFTPQGGIGVHWFRSPRASLSFGVRYHHISNAGRVKPNPGHNALYFYGGLSWWR